MNMQSATASSDERHACWTHWEQALAEVLVESMLQVGKASDRPAEVHASVYIDGTLAANCGQSDRQSTPSRNGTIGEAQLDRSWSTLQRVGMAAADLYCLRVFGRQFDAVSNLEQRGVLRVLDSIKLVFQDGSDAGAFCAAVYQAVMNPTVFDQQPRMAA